jgi:hypothetical protein
MRTLIKPRRSASGPEHRGIVADGDVFSAPLRKRRGHGIFAGCKNHRSVRKLLRRVAG